MNKLFITIATIASLQLGACERCYDNLVERLQYLKRVQAEVDKSKLDDTVIVARLNETAFALITILTHHPEYSKRDK